MRKIRAINFRESDGKALVTFEDELYRTHIVSLDDITTKSDFINYLKTNCLKRTMPRKTKFVTLQLKSLEGESI